MTPYSHRLAEELGDPELQRLRCRVNYHALKFKPFVMDVSNKIVRKLRAEGHFMSIHLRFEKDMLAFSGYACSLFFQKSDFFLFSYLSNKLN